MGGVLDADYLVVGAGASGMAFADSLITSSDAEVVIVDRRHGPGGHWNDTYPFIRLHQPSAYYGVNSMPLGTDTIDTQGVNAGMYERASGNELCAYYETSHERPAACFRPSPILPAVQLCGRRRNSFRC